MGSRVATLGMATAAIVGFVLGMVGSVIAGDLGAPVGGNPTDIVEFYQSLDYGATLAAGIVLETLGLLLMMAFVSYLARVVGGRPDETPWAGTLIVASVVVATTLTIFSVVALGAGAFRAAHGGLAQDGYVVLSDLRFVAYWLSLPAWALVYLPAGAAMIRARTFASWLGWVGIAIGLAHVVLAFLPASTWDIGVVIGAFWVVVIAGVMLVRPGNYSRPAQ